MRLYINIFDYAIYREIGILRIFAFVQETY